MSYLAQGSTGERGDPSVFDNRVLDQFEIPFGEWIDQAVDWTDVRLKWLLNLIKWPFDTLISFVVQDTLEPASWVIVVLAFFVIGTLVRNVKVGAFAAVALGVCGILGNAYWLETARTIGFIGVAVLLCVVIGIPLGIACGRIDSLWQSVRPVLDAMQVVHSFVYMLPFIFFFGVGEVSAAMVTMVFALPPLVRLTNLGVRQVPEDVVEASRAYGAPEWRVLLDVQIPLARPAIMTGINQTLLLSISMLGIAAIMGAGGLGRPLFRALSEQRVSQGSASGLAFFLVAVVLDRISQPEGTRGSLLRRIGLAWRGVWTRQDPRMVLDAYNIGTSPSDAESGGRGVFTPVSQSERTPMLIAAAGGFLAVVSVFLTWSSGAGFISAYGRRVDEQLAGQSFNGLSATGGSWFGYLALALGLFAMASVVVSLRTPGRGPRFLSSDGCVMASVALLVMMIAYTLASPSDFTVGQSKGIGVYLALVGALTATVGSLWWVRLAPCSPVRPLSVRIGWGRVLASAIAVATIGIGAISAWSFDRRADVVLSPEDMEYIQALKEREEANPADAAVISAEVLTFRASRQEENVIITDGISGKGTGLGWWTSLAALVGFAVSLRAAGIPTRGEHKQWRWSAVTAGIGAGVASVSFGWIFTHVRSADPDYLSGIGSFLVMSGGAMLVATTVGIIKEFRRVKIYADDGVAFAEVNRELTSHRL